MTYFRVRTRLLGRWIVLLVLMSLFGFSTQAVADQAFKHGYKFQDCDICPKMIVVRGDTFIMGSPKNKIGKMKNRNTETPQRKVQIQTFAVGRFEITFDEWDACVKGGGCNKYRPHDEGWGRGNLPVINVSWNDAKSYVKWLSQKTGKQYRLLTEAEWEYVAGAKTSTPYWWGTSISTHQANYSFRHDKKPNAIRRQKTVPVDSFSANPFGLYNVHGNATEWVEDCWHGNYKDASSDGSARLSVDDEPCIARVIRGGDWVSHPEEIRTRYRFSLPRGLRDPTNGFRVARNLINK